MLARLWLAVLALTLVAGGGAFAQNPVRTQPIKPPEAAAPPGKSKFEADAHIVVPEEQASAPEIIVDLARLPAPVATMRERILAAARSGDLEKLAAITKSHNPATIFSFGDDKDPVAYWKANYPESEGVEVLAILLTILEAGFVHVDTGTPQEVYLWPYFARMPLNALTAEQKVALLRIATGADFEDMVEFGAYSFYRLGIAPDGTWQFFVSGD